MNKGNYKNGEIELLRENIAYTNKYCSLYNDDVIFPSGVQGTYLRLTYNKPFSVAVLPVTKDNRFVLIKTFRHAARGWGLEIPKGFGEIGEKPIDAAIRELQEETGINSSHVEFLGRFSESPSVVEGDLYCFIATGCEIKEKISIEDTEAISGTIVIDNLNSLKDYDYHDAITEMMILKYSILQKQGDNNE